MNGTDPRENDVRPVFACLGVASRFRLVRELAGADRCVGELAAAVGLSQSCTTRHLQALERLGLVKGQREGRRVRFRLSAGASGLGGLLGLALPEAGREARVAGGDLQRDRAATRPSGPGGSPDGGTRRSRPRGGPTLTEAAEPESASVPTASTGAGEDGSEETSRGSDSSPALRRGDLEDYLL